MMGRGGACLSWICAMSDFQAAALPAETCRLWRLKGLKVPEQNVMRHSLLRGSPSILCTSTYLQHCIKFCPRCLLVPQDICKFSYNNAMPHLADCQVDSDKCGSLICSYLPALVPHAPAATRPVNGPYKSYSTNLSAARQWAPQVHGIV